MTRNAKQKAATSPKAATSNANAEKPTGCRCAAQLQIPGFPPPPPALGMQEVPPMYSNDATTFAARYPSLKDLRAKADCMRYPK